MDAGNSVDIAIIGAGIAGLWTAAHLTRKGYSVLLLEKNAVGGTQTIASQGIIHSGFKYTLAGTISPLAKAMSAMPDRWRKEINASLITSQAHHLMIPKSFIGNVMKITAEQTFSAHVQKLSQTEWATNKKQTGFDGSVLALNEPVMDVPGVLRFLSGICPAKKIDEDIRPVKSSDESIKGVWIGDQFIATKAVVFTAAESNLPAAKTLEHVGDLQTQIRPLLMGMMRPAPFPLFAHLIGASEKPLATITTHTGADGAPVWYVGGKVAERMKNDWPHNVYNSIKKVLAQYISTLDYAGMEWATHGVDRVESKGGITWLPDTPVIHQMHNAYYCWPTKLAFAPLLAERIESDLMKSRIKPSGVRPVFSFLADAPFAKTPWDTAAWTKLN